MRAHRRPITEAQRLAWENLSKAFGDERYYVEIPSAREVAQAGIEALQAEAERLLTDPNVQRAYQRFLFVCELTRKHDV